MAASPDEMAQSMIANMPEKTGKPLEQWLKIVAAARKANPDALAKHGQILKHLKAEHGLTHGYANLVAHKFLDPDVWRPGNEADLVDTQYAGPKAALRPIYDAILQAVAKFGDDVEVSPKKTYVSLRRSKQFAIVQPSTRTRVDLGLNLKGVQPAGRLEPAGSLGSMVTHRVRLESPKDVDKEVISHLKAAYTNS